MSTSTTQDPQHSPATGSGAVGRPPNPHRGTSATVVARSTGNGDTTSKTFNDIANPAEKGVFWKRFAMDLLLGLLIIIMIVWPWAFFGAVHAKHGIQMYGRLADTVDQYPQMSSAVVTFIGTVIRLLATFLFGRMIVRFSQEWIAASSEEKVTVFEVSALFAFRHLALSAMFGITKEQLKNGKWRRKILVLLLVCLGTFELVPTGIAGLITPGQFNRTASLTGTELDFASTDPGCLAWLEANSVADTCDWKSLGNTQFSTCLGETQMFDVLDSGRAHMLHTIINKTETSSLTQLGGNGGIRFLGSAKGVLPIGPDGVLAFNTLVNTSNPLVDEKVRRHMISYNYTLTHQGLESTVSCSYENTSPIRFERLSTLNSTNYEVDYLSEPRYFATRAPTRFPHTSLQAVQSRFIERAIQALGDVVSEAQNWSANLLAEAVFSLGAKELNLSTREKDTQYLSLYEAMIQGMLAYEITYSRLVYNVNAELNGIAAPEACVRQVGGQVSYAVKGWYIPNPASQAGLLIPMTLINLASFTLLIISFVMGKLKYRFNFDATSSVQLLAAVVPEEVRPSPGEIEWKSPVDYLQTLAQAGASTVPN
ncbi:hypothetical protein MD484_g7090, partial [Candolleomyces efflorescens]